MDENNKNEVAATADSTRVAIDPEFQALVASPRESELQELEKSIVRDGCLEPLSVWEIDDRTILLDGHNRYKLCEKHKIAFQLRSVKLDSRDHARLWIEEHQIARRNLTDDQRAIIWDSIRERRSKLQVKERAAKANAVRHGKASSVVKSAPKEKTRAYVARESGLPESMIRKAQLVAKKSPELALAVRVGKLSLNEARAKTRKAEQTAHPKATEPSRKDKAFAQITNLYKDVDPEIRANELKLLMKQVMSYFVIFPEAS